MHKIILASIAVGGILASVSVSLADTSFIFRYKSGLVSQAGPPTVDTDGDGIPDATDPDDDNDGVPDVSDPAPLDPQVPGNAGTMTLVSIPELGVGDPANPFPAGLKPSGNSVYPYNASDCFYVGIGGVSSTLSLEVKAPGMPDGALKSSLVSSASLIDLGGYGYPGKQVASLCPSAFYADRGTYQVQLAFKDAEGHSLTAAFPLAVNPRQHEALALDLSDWESDIDASSPAVYDTGRLLSFVVKGGVPPFAVSIIGGPDSYSQNQGALLQSALNAVGRSRVADNNGNAYRWQIIASTDIPQVNVSDLPLGGNITDCTVANQMCKVRAEPCLVDGGTPRTGTLGITISDSTGATVTVPQMAVHTIDNYTCSNRTYFPFWDPATQSHTGDPQYPSDHIGNWIWTAGETVPLP